ncbi:MAG: Tat pathway signal protein, partial [Betaproteobacteria bacterium]|nr:Tat pathway signal protein [Betaproteobacteria bacterium]
MKRRDLLKGMASGLLSPLGVSATLTGALGLGLPQLARAADYRALVVVFLKGGYDGNDMLVPLDAGYNDYSKGRSDLALKKDELVPLGRGYAGGPLGMHPALKPLQSIYEQGRMAWV